MWAREFVGRVEGLLALVQLSSTPRTAVYKLEVVATYMLDRASIALLCKHAWRWYHLSYVR